MTWEPLGAAHRASSTILGSLMRANFPLRLVGKVESANDARVASGRAGTNAHLLNGRGDFLAAAGGDSPIRFQVAYIDEKDLQRQMTALREERVPFRAQLPALAHRSVV